MFIASKRAKYAITNFAIRRTVSILAPKESAIDDTLDIKVVDLSPRQDVTIVAQTTRKDVTLSSFANYKADDRGIVDFKQHSALPGGTFTGVEPMGLFWSGELTSKIKVPFRMLSGNDLDSWSYEISAYNGHRKSLDEALQSKSSPISKTQVDRLFLPKGVKRLDITYGKLRATLFLPEGPGKFPAIIDIFGGANGMVAYRGGLFAKHGFACLCVAYAAYADLPKELTSINLEYFNSSFKFLSEHPSVNSNAIGTLGSCIGGTIANALARCQPGIKAVAAVSPEPFAGTFLYELQVNGKSITIPGINWNTRLLKARDGAFDIQPCILPSIEKSGGYHKSLLDYGKIKAPMLFMYGSDDQFFTLDYMIPIIQQQFDKETKTNAEIIVYPDAGHIIQPPYMPMFGKYFSPFFGKQIWFGGKLVPHARAQEQMWQKTLAFFRKHLC